jgi:hypothetical protein
MSNHAKPKHFRNEIEVRETETTKRQASSLRTVDSPLASVEINVAANILRLKRAGRCCLSEDTTPRDCLINCQATLTFQRPDEIYLD